MNIEQSYKCLFLCYIFFILEEDEVMITSGKSVSDKLLNYIQNTLIVILSLVWLI